MHESRVKVRRLRIVLAIATALALVVSGALAVVAQFLQWDGLFTPGPGWDDGYTLQAIEVVGELDDEGVLHVTEDFTVQWHEPRRGLIRDISDAGVADNLLTVENVDVQSDTQDDVWFETRGYRGLEVHLGEEFDFRPLGVDHYQITYELHGMLVDFNDNPTLRWNTFGDQWDTLIEYGEVTLQMPEEVVSYGCAYGAEGEAYPCDGDGPTFSGEDFRPGRGLTVEAQLANEPANMDSPLRSSGDLRELERFDSIAWARLWMVLSVAAIPGVPLIVSFGSQKTRRLRREAADRVKTTGVAYVPPHGVTPVTGAMLANGQRSGVNDSHLFAAWLLDAQQRGLIQVEETGSGRTGGYRVAGTGAGEYSSQLETAVVQALLPIPNAWNDWNSSTPDARARKLQSAWTSYLRQQQHASGVPNSVNGMPDGLVGSVLFVGVLGAIALWSLGYPAAFLLAAAVITAWTVHGIVNGWLRVAVGKIPESQLADWRAVEGLRRFVDEAHADQISWAQENPEIPLTDAYLELLPWVIALGSGEKWAQRFPRQMAQVTQSTGFYAPMTAAQMTRVRSVSTPTSSSSGGGGGASSGGGSGGGGGGGSSR